MDTVWVTGGAGFIGSALCERLLELGYRVVAVDNLATGRRENLARALRSDRFRLVEADVNHDDLEPLFKEEPPRYLFHYAALVGVKRTLEHPLAVMEDLLGTRRLLAWAHRFGVEKVVYASSSEVYGEPVEIPEREDGHLNAKLPYAVVKLAGEKFMEAYHQEHGLRTTSLRLFNVYGPRQNFTPYGFVVGIFISQVLSGQPPTIYGDGSQTRDFVYIDDNVEAAVLTLENTASDGLVINIGTGRPTTIIDLAEDIIRLCGKEGELEPVFLPPRPHEVKHRFPDVGRMRAILGFRPRVKLEEGLRRTIAYYRYFLQEQGVLSRGS